MIRATVAWSVDLLDPPARQVLAALSLFPAGATLESLETVAEPGTEVAGGRRRAPRRESRELVDGRRLGAPIHDARNDPRVRGGRAGDDDLRRAQLEWSIALASDDEEPRYWTRATAWLDRVEPELPNIRAALDFAREQDDVRRELRLASAMRHYWRVRGHGIEGRRRLEEAMERISEVEPALGARVQHETAVMRLVAGDFDGARTLWLSALEEYQRLGIEIEVGRVYAELGALENAAGNPEEAIGYSETASQMLAHEEFIRLIVLGNLAESYEQTGDLERARTTAMSVLEAQRAIADRDGVAYMSYTLASVALASGDIAESHRRLIECLTVAAEVGFVEVTGYALGLAADIALALDDLQDAAMLIGACLERFAQLGVAPHVREGDRQARVVARSRSACPRRAS